jgi:hypothetical protein
MFVNGIAVDTVIDGVDPILAGTFGVRRSRDGSPRRSSSTTSW